MLRWFPTLVAIACSGARNTSSHHVPTPSRVADGRDRAASETPTFHITPLAYFMNDPDGPMWDPVHEKFHLFYGVYPPPDQGPDLGGYRFWAHAISDDLAHWKRLPDAFVPDRHHMCDATGAHSGSATVVNGSVTILYTGTLAPRASAGKGQQGAQVQCMATPLNRSDPELKDWVRTGPLTLQPPSGGGPTAFRDDTTAWRWGNAWRMAVGASIHDSSGGGGGGSEGVAAVYESTDLRNWGAAPVALIRGLDGDVSPRPTMWECPDVFPLGDPSAHWAVKFSAHPYDYYSVGQFSDNGTFMNGTPASRIDAGTTYYASKSFVDGKGRRILWGWIAEELPCSASTSRCSVQSVPREVRPVPAIGKALFGTEAHAALAFPPVEELQLLRNMSTGVIHRQWLLKANEPWSFPLTTHIDVNITVGRDAVSRSATECPGNHPIVDIVVLQSTTEQTVITVDLQNFTRELAVSEVPITINRSMASATHAPQPPVRWSTLVDSSEPTLQVQALVDATVVEVFVQQGRTVASTRVYPTSGGVGVSLVARGCNVTLSSVELYAMEPMWVN